MNKKPLLLNFRNISFLFILVLLVSYLTYQFTLDTKIITKKVNTGEILFSKLLEPTPPLRKLLIKEKISSSEYETILNQTQLKWLRKVNSERWDIKDTNTHVYKKYFKKLGLVDAIYPTKSNVDYIIILGGTAPTMIKRMKYLKFLLENKKISYKYLVILTGLRKLHPQADFKGITNSYFVERIKSFKTENEVADFLVHQMFIKPNLIDSNKIDLVNSKQFAGARPNTDDTVKAWMKKKPTPGSILAISNQPYVGRQSAVLQSILPKTFSIEVVGEKARNDLGDKLLLDSLARWIYQLSKL